MVIIWKCFKPKVRAAKILFRFILDKRESLVLIYRIVAGIVIILLILIERALFLTY